MIPATSLFIVFLQIAFSAAATETDTISSLHVKDKFVISIKKPASYSQQKKYHHVYITDGSIGMGDYILGKSDGWKATIPSTCIIIAISHIGDWDEKRPRDFIPSDISKNSAMNFGKANQFYLFLQKELIPVIEKNYPIKKTVYLSAILLAAFFVCILYSKRISYLISILRSVLLSGLIIMNWIK